METESDDEWLAAARPPQKMRSSGASDASPVSGAAVGDAAGALGPSQRAGLWAIARETAKHLRASAVAGGRPREMTVRVLVEEARQLLVASARPKARKQPDGGGGGGGTRPEERRQQQQLLLESERAQAQAAHVRASSLVQTVVCRVACGEQHAHTRPTKTTTGSVRWMHSCCFYYNESVDAVLEKSLVFSVCHTVLLLQSSGSELVYSLLSSPLLCVSGRCTTRVSIARTH